MSEPRQKDSIATAGIPNREDVSRLLPSPERLLRGPVAVIECFQEIPCDPCADACPEGAIRPFSHICDLPAIDYDACTGCGLCVVRCPGLAIFLVDLSKGDDTAEVRIPYEYLPLPDRNEEVIALDRHGREVAKAVVLRAQKPKSFDRTAIVTVRVPREVAMSVRGIRLGREGDEGQ